MFTFLVAGFAAVEDGEKEEEPAENNREGVEGGEEGEAFEAE